MNLRDELLIRLRSERFDLLIIGGGIVGAGIARDAAMRGLKVALIEKGDFASGTSSKTSKLIHGGLRYLEHGHIRLVRESLRERHVLRTIAPGLVHPLSLLLSAYEGDARAPWKINAGLWLYDLLALGRNIRAHRMVSAHRALLIEPGLRVDGLLGAGIYSDCRMDDARLCLANILQAIGFGAVCCNYMGLRELIRSNGQLCGGIGEDAFSQDTIEIQAEVVVNATGPWADRTMLLSDSGSARRIAPTKGIHILLPLAIQRGLFIQSRKDSRMIFLIPWDNMTLVGTTESSVDGPLEMLQANADEVGYLLDEVNRVLPEHHFDEDSVLATYAGARPLLAFSGTPTQASREHRIEVDRWGLVSIIGGKYTTYRLMSEQAVDFIIRRNSWKAGCSLTKDVSLLDTVNPVTLDHWQDITRRIDPDLLARLLTRYGAGTFGVLGLIDRDPSLIQPVCQHHEVIEAEIAYFLRQELACTVIDLMFRRTHIAFSACQGLDFISDLSHLMEQYGGVSSSEAEQQIGAYRDYLARTLSFRSRSCINCTNSSDSKANE